MSTKKRDFSAIIKLKETTNVSDQPPSSFNSHPIAKIQSRKSVRDLDIHRISPSLNQPRKHFDPSSLEDLASSIRHKGVLQPIAVKRRGEGFELIYGERRWRASKIAGKSNIPCIIYDEVEDANELRLIENIQREDLDAIEVAISFQRLIEECKLTQEQLSDRVGKQRSTVTNYLRLLKLPAEIQLGIKNKQLMMGHARTLINIEDPKKQISVYYKIIDGELSVRQAEELVRHLQSESIKDPSKLERKQKLNQDFSQLSDHLNRIFSAKVSFRINELGKGKIVIPFENPDEMERILGIFDRLNS